MNCPSQIVDNSKVVNPCVGWAIRSLIENYRKELAHQKENREEDENENTGGLELLTDMCCFKHEIINV
jgi:hypothetical protein